MSVEQAIHEFWSTCHPLKALVPVANVYTGSVPRADAAGDMLVLPWVSVETVGDSATVRTGSGTTLTTAKIRFHIYAASYATAKEIVELLLDHFDRAEFNWSRGRVLDMKHVNQGETEEGNGTWRMIVDYATKITREAGT